MGSVTVLFLPLYPIIYLFLLLSNLFGTMSGANVSEVALPYDEANGIVWTCDKTDYDWFELSETRVEGDTQVFSFKGNGKESHCTSVVFTDENGNEVVYYARDDSSAFSTLGKAKLYAPDEYIIYDYVPEPEIKCENGFWHLITSGTQTDDYYFGTHEVDGKEVIRVICFDGVQFSHNYSYHGWNEDRDNEYNEDVKVIYEYTKEGGLKVKEFPKIYIQSAQ